MHNTISKCRICGNDNLVPVINLGPQFMDGVFPRSMDEPVESLELEVVKCHGGEKDGHCGLLQLKHQHLFGRGYWENYGYRSGLNGSMVSSLRGIAAKALSMKKPSVGDILLDIGSNDATLLKACPQNIYKLVGMDPGGENLKKYYPDGIRLVSEEFSSRTYFESLGIKKASIITSIAMLYDVASPLDFMKQICEVLADDGIWVFEQSYMPAMLRKNAYDTICHEHLSYFGFSQIKWLAERAGLKIIDVEFTSINGGSFLVTAAKESSTLKENRGLCDGIIKGEKEQALDTLRPYKKFKENVNRHRKELKAAVRSIKANGKSIIGYGASTKGNVLLQFCGLTREDIPYIAEINEDKIGRYTPYSNIPIISESAARAMKPDYLFVLPWHFKDYFLEKEKEYLQNGGHLIFPLPEIEVLGTHL